MPIAMKARQIPQLDSRSSAAQFLEEHDILMNEVAGLKEQNCSLNTACASLLAEVAMLREELERTDRARIRLQGFAANLTARLSVINETIAIAIKEAAAHHVDPIPVPMPEPLPVTAENQEAEAVEVLNVIERLPRNVLPPNNQF